MTTLLAVNLPHWLAKTMQVAFFVGAIGAGVVVLFVIKDYLGVVFSKDEPADATGPKPPEPTEVEAAPPQQPQTAR